MKLHIFDFDGTLFKTPMNTPENRKLVEDATGLPWLISKKQAIEFSKKLKRVVGMRRGWYGRPETLEPPLVPDPAPSTMFYDDICEQFFRSKADPNAHTVILTGRHAGLKGQVLRILDDGKLVKCTRTVDKGGKRWFEVCDPEVSCYFLGQDGPCPTGTKPPDTLPWKMWMIKQFIKSVPGITSVEMWEDRYEHVVEFTEFLDSMKNVEGKVHYVNPT
jgi:hypothetical protein